MRKVNPGEPLRFPAATFNTFVDTAQDFLDRRSGGGAGDRPVDVPANQVLVKNSSGYDCPRFGILALDGPLWEPPADEEAFLREVVVSCILPWDGEDCRVVIAVEPIADGAIGYAQFAGLTPVEIDVTDAAHTEVVIRFDSSVADIEKFASAATIAGDAHPARLIWKEAGTGTVWGLIDIAQHGSLSSGGNDVRWGEAKALWVTASGNGSYVDVNPCDDLDGTNVDTGTTVRVYLPRSGQNGDPNVREDDVIAYVVTDSDEAVCVSAYMDEPIGAIAWSRLVADPRIGRGWSLYTAIDERVPVGYTGAGDYTIENEIGASTHQHATAGDHQHTAGGGHTHTTDGIHAHDSHTRWSMPTPSQGAMDILLGPTTHSSDGGHTHDAITAHQHDSAGYHQHALASNHQPSLVLVCIERTS